MLATFGGAAGLLVAYWATQALVMLTAGALTVGRTEPIGLDVTCLVFTLVVSTITALVFGLVPAWQASRVEPQAALREQSRGGTADRRHHRLRSLLVVTEVALAVVLLVGAGLLLRTLSSLIRVDLGFQPAETITMGLFLGLRPPEARIARRRSDPRSRRGGAGRQGREHDPVPAADGHDLRDRLLARRTGAG